MKKHKRTLIITGTIIASTLILGASAYAAASPAQLFRGNRRGHMATSTSAFSSHMKPMVVGVVSDVKGTIITVNGKNGTTYAVDAANAKITAGFGPTATIESLSAIAVNDQVAVIGTVSGDSVAATAIMEGIKSPSFKGFNKKMLAPRNATSTSPHVIGTVTSVSGNGFTIESRRHNKTASTASDSFSVSTTDATVFMKNGKLDSISDVAIGSYTIVTGAIDQSAHTIAASGVNIFEPMKKKAQ